MSVILITQHDENIYNLTEEEIAGHQRSSPRYYSKYSEKARAEHAKRLDKRSNGHAMMGLPEYIAPKPSEYLRKGTRQEPKAVTDEPRCLNPQKLPPVPNAEEVKQRDELLKKVHQERDINYIIKNIKAVLKAVPKHPMSSIKPYQCGKRQELSQNFGRTPQYLQRVISRRARDLQLKKDSFGAEQPKCRYITRQEREELLGGLKQNWEELQSQYQGLPILTDTIPKINRKSKIEADLKQLEKDIVLIERHPYIYVYNDNEPLPGQAPLPPAPPPPT